MSQNPRLSSLETLVECAADLGQGWCAKRDELVLDEKSAGQFASNADLEIEQLIRNQLAEMFPDEPIIGEELGGALAPDQSGWVLDPIDGTSNFVLGLPIWGISIGYLERGRSVLGAIALPELGLTLMAAEGTGLLINGARATDTYPKTAVKLMALGENDYEAGSETDFRAQSFRDRGFAVVRYRCAVFSLSMAALGRLSGYVEQGCGLWDIAAAEIICKEAGMTIQTANIAPGRYAVDAHWR